MNSLLDAMKSKLGRVSLLKFAAVGEAAAAAKVIQIVWLVIPRTYRLESASDLEEALNGGRS